MLSNFKLYQTCNLQYFERFYIIYIIIFFDLYFVSILELNNNLEKFKLIDNIILIDL